MIKHIKINNYKSLIDFSLSLTPLTVIVGNNAAGKSTILQAIDFMCRSVQEDFISILDNRGLKIENIKSKLAPASAPVRFEAEIEIEESGETYNYLWEMEINTRIAKNSIWLQEEKIKDLNCEKYLLSYGKSVESCIWDDEKNETIQLPEIMSYQSSVLKMINGEAGTRLSILKRFLMNSSSFELLSPDEMRMSSRGWADTIGMSGRTLPSFIKGMPQEKKQRFMKKIQQLLGDTIENVGTRTQARPGWTQVVLTESYENKKVSVASKDISDGTLRLLAFVAISEIQKPEAVMLLDEIENGINTNYAEKLLDILRGAWKEKRHQMIVTTHSTAFLDYVEGKEIVFLYRDKQTGVTCGSTLFDIPKLKEKLDYMYPGEVILNYTNEKLVEILLKH